jgi:acetylornithine deacetylase
MRDDLIDLTSQLVAIDSINPALVPDGAGEAKIAAFVADWARAAGLEADLLEDTPGRPSVIVRSRGTGGGRTLLLCAHLDTVGVDGMPDPHTPRVDGDRLYGRGAYDMKASLAASLLACREAARLGLAGDVVVAAVADEEHSSIGVQQALRSVTADAAIVTEPTELELIVAHKGFVWIEIEVSGRAAHGSRPDLGVDAICQDRTDPHRDRRARRETRRPNAPAPRPRLGPRVADRGRRRTVDVPRDVRALHRAPNTSR